MIILCQCALWFLSFHCRRVRGIVRRWLNRSMSVAWERWVGGVFEAKAIKGKLNAVCQMWKNRGIALAWNRWLERVMQSRYVDTSMQVYVLIDVFERVSACDTFVLFLLRPLRLPCTRLSSHSVVGHLILAVRQACSGHREALAESFYVCCLGAMG